MPNCRYQGGKNRKEQLDIISVAMVDDVTSHPLFNASK